MTAAPGAGAGLCLVLDCADPHRLAGFWAAALSYQSSVTCGSACFPRRRDRSAGGRRPTEVTMRTSAIALLIWLLIGAFAGAQRHYYSSSAASCSRAGTIAVTVLAGPLNYAGVNPQVSCRVPTPSR